MKRSTKIITSIAAVAALVATGSVFARDKGQMHAKHMMLSQHAIVACANQTDGANVVFDHPMWGKVNAVCAKSLHNNQLVAMPAKMVEHMKAAVAACSGKAEGDKVSINDMRNEGKTIEATCKKRGDVLAARPEHMGRGEHKGMKM